MEVDHGEPPKIPIETWQCIFRFLTRSGDLYNVSLTSRYMYDAVQPILCQRLCLDPNYYTIYTLSLLQRRPGLCLHVSHLTLLQETQRDVPSPVKNEATRLYCDLGLPVAKCPHGLDGQRSQALLWTPLGLQGNPQRSSVLGGELCIRPIFSFIPRFVNLTCLQILDDVVPPDFLNAISSFKQMKILILRDVIVSPELKGIEGGTTLPIRELTMIRCLNKPYMPDTNAAGLLCDILIRCSRNLRLLVMDTFVERVAFNVLSDLESPPPIEVFVSSGMTPPDLDTNLLKSLFSNLPTITTLNMTRIPRELGGRLPKIALPKLVSIKGQIKSVGIFFNGVRPLQEVTITDAPATAAGGISWDTQLIQFFESIGAYKGSVPLRSLTFCVDRWSEEVFLCVCQLFPKLRTLKIQCNTDNVDQYFRISFGPRFLTIFTELEVLHIFERTQPRCTTVQTARGTKTRICSKLDLSAEDMDELMEAPNHYRRWERFSPSLREVAFDREAWWKKIGGDWTFMREVLFPLAQTSSTPAT